MAADQKRAAAESAWIVFFDESGISLIPPVRRTWSPRSRTPILRHRYHWKRASMAAALGDHADGTRARWCFHLQADSYDSDSLIKVLEQMAGFYTGHKVVLLWDGLSAHWSYKLRAHLDQQRDWLTVERLPAYAPELNAVEYLWANLKGTEPANFAGDTVAEVADQAQHGIQRVCASDSLVLGFLAQLARSSGRPGDQVRSRRGRRRLLACVGDGSTHGDDGPQQGGAMTATPDVLDLVQRWAAAEQGNDAQALEGLLAARPH